jgi:hypothetical protein
MATHFRLRDFMLDGVLGGARVGMNRGEIQRILGHPDQWAGERCETAGIWRFGLFEVHFGDDDRAWLLFTDYLTELDPGSGRTVDPWFLDGAPASRTQSVVVANLEREGKRLSRGHVADVLVIRIESGAELDFDGTSDNAMLSAISAIVAGGARHLDAIGETAAEMSDAQRGSGACGT